MTSIEMTHDEFDALLQALIDEAPASHLLLIPGVYEIVSEEFNNEVLQRWAARLETGRTKMQIHPSLTLDRVLEAAKAQMFDLENPGFCVACGEETDGCEPDARRYKCECCGKRAVYGAEELMMMLA